MDLLTDKLKLVIVLPAGVVHYIGTKQNYDDVIIGLILQRHSPFLFHFDNLALCNFPNTLLAGAILDRLVNPAVGILVAVLNRLVSIAIGTLGAMLDQLVNLSICTLGAILDQLINPG